MSVESNEQERLTDKPAPWLFDKLLRFYRWLIPEKVRSYVELILFGVAPEVPVVLRDGLPRVALWRVFSAGATIGFLLSFVVIAVWTWAEGTLYGSSPKILYFIEDIPNIVNYTIVVPGYVGSGSTLIAAVIYGWGNLRRTVYEWGEKVNNRPWIVAVSVLLIIGISSLSTSSYISEVLSKEVYEKRYWFVSHVSGSGDRVLGALGIYYSILNFWLLAFTLTVVVAFMSSFRISMLIGKSLSNKKGGSPLTDDQLKRSLRTFTIIYMWSKITVAIYMINAYTWIWERPEGSLNLLLMGAALTVIGVILVSVPRYYIEIKWLKYKHKYKLEEEPSHLDIRPFRVRLAANLADAVIISGFVIGFWMEAYSLYV